MTRTIMIRLSKLWLKRDTVASIEFDKPAQGISAVTVITLDNGQWFILSNEDPNYASDVCLLKRMHSPY